MNLDQLLTEIERACKIASNKRWVRGFDLCVIKNARSRPADQIAVFDESKDAEFAVCAHELLPLAGKILKNLLDFDSASDLRSLLDEIAERVLKEPPDA